MGVLAHGVMHCVLGHIDRRRDRRAGQDPKRSSADSDLHLDPSDPEGAAERRSDFPAPLEPRRLSVTLTREVTRKLHGRQSGILAEQIRRATSAQVPWQSLLARFFTGLRRNDFRHFPPNRKHLWRGPYLPSLGTRGPEHVVVAIDTSGSMSAEVLGEAFGELDQLRSVSECRLTLLECDAGVQRASTLAPYELSTRRFDRCTLHGRGATDLRPPFAWVGDNFVQTGQRPDALFHAYPVASQGIDSGRWPQFTADLESPCSAATRIESRPYEAARVRPGVWHA